MLEVEGLTAEFTTRRGPLKAVNDVTFAVRPGESVGLIGESGSGKTTTGLSILRLVRRPGRIVSGRIMYEGADLLRMGKREIRSIRGNRVALVSQNPMTSLDPTVTVGAQVVEAIRSHRRSSRGGAAARARELMDAVGIPSARERMRAYPHELSGGLRQRITIAMALANDPDLLIADEPTTALDVTIQAHVLDLLRDLQRQLGMSLLFITHDLGIAAQMCHRIIVMYAGRIVEVGPTATVLKHPHHPYTAGLLKSIPVPGKRAGRLTAIEGQPPDLVALPPGCAFAPRCPRVQPESLTGPPELRDVDGTGAHKSACVLPGR